MPIKLLAGAKTSRLSGIALSGSLGTTFLSARRVCLRDFSNHPVSSNRWFLTNVDHFILLRSSSSAPPTNRNAWRRRRSGRCRLYPSPRLQQTARRSSTSRIYAEALDVAVHHGQYRFLWQAVDQSGELLVPLVTVLLVADHSPPAHLTAL